MIKDYPKIEKKPLKVKGCKYDPEKYPTYDNYMAINVDKCVEIPIDYDGVIGVPITILAYLFSDGTIHIEYENDIFLSGKQFEIVDAANRYLLLDYFNVNERVIREHDHCTNINGKPTYFRILIRKKVS